MTETYPCKEKECRYRQSYDLDLKLKSHYPLPLELIRCWFCSRFIKKDMFEKET